MNNLNKITIYGDSIMKGIVIDRSTNRYCVSDENIGLRDIEQKYSVNVKTNALFGCTAVKGFERIKKHFDKSVDSDIVLLEYGGNDCDFDWSEVSARPDEPHEPKTPIETFSRVYRSMIEYLRSKGVVPVLSTLPPVCSEKYLSWICREGLSRENILKWLGDADEIGRFQKTYSDLIVDIARSAGCLWVDFRREFLCTGKADDLFCDDGIHPNHAGQRIINRSLCRALEQNLVTA